MKRRSIEADCDGRSNGQYITPLVNVCETKGVDNEFFIPSLFTSQKDQKLCCNICQRPHRPSEHFCKCNQALMSNFGSATEWNSDDRMCLSRGRVQKTPDPSVDVERQDHYQALTSDRIDPIDSTFEGLRNCFTRHTPQILNQAVSRVLTQIPVIILGTLFAILDNVPYGLLMFPPGFEKFEVIGATIALLSTCIAQMIFSVTSKFKFACGAYNVENIPFLHSISVNVAAKLTSLDRLDCFLPTVLACFVIVSILTAICFWLLGYFHCGTFCNYIPKHVLLGCISGMGIFIVTAGIGISSGVRWSWSPHVLYEQFFVAENFIKWIIPLSLEMFLLYLRSTKYSQPLLTPTFLVSIPIIFYCVLFSFGISVKEAREAGWLFPERSETVTVSDANNLFVKLASGIIASPMSSSDSWWSYVENFNVYRSLSYKLILWNVVASQSLLICALVFFSVLHAPLNLPMLALATRTEMDLNKELKAHAWTNLATGLACGGQTYLTYSSSLVYKLSGLKDRWASFTMGLLSASFIFFNPSFILTFFPRPAAGIFLMHVGMELVKDGLYTSYFCVDILEYCTVLMVGFGMQIDFLQAIFVGMAVAFVLFILQASRINVIHAAYRAKLKGNYSNRLRRAVNEKSYVIELQGTLFFGNSHSIFTYIENLIVRNPRLEYVVLDFSRVGRLDCSTADKIEFVLDFANERENPVTVVCVGMAGDAFSRVRHLPHAVGEPFGFGISRSDIPRQNFPVRRNSWCSQFDSQPEIDYEKSNNVVEAEKKRSLSSCGSDTQVELERQEGSTCSWQTTEDLNDPVHKLMFFPTTESALYWCANKIAATLPKPSRYKLVRRSGRKGNRQQRLRRENYKLTE